MKKHIGLIRGINVGGHNKIRMVDLRSMCDEIGFKNTKTYIQSGNLVVRADQNSQDIARVIKSSIKDKFNVDANVIFIEANEFTAIREAYPFDVKDHKEAHIVFLSETPSKEAIAELSKIDTGEDKIKITNNAVYLALPNGVSGAKVTFKAIESALKVSGTARNRRTIDKLIKLANSPKF